jgi:hypothetical protein
MTLPEQVLLKRRLQIRDDETRDGDGFDARAHDDGRACEDSWVNHFVARLTALIRDIGNKP